MALARTAKMVVPEGVLVRELGGESVILNLNSESYFGLDDVGTRMWAALTAAESIEAAYQSLLEEYDVNPEKLTEDLDALIDKLVAQGLLEVAGG
jgi:hypothetical protein